MSVPGCPLGFLCESGYLAVCFQPLFTIVSMIPALLLSYHRRLMMISDALELRMEGGRVSHSWYLCVVSHGNGGLGWGKNGGSGCYVCGTKPGGLVACREMTEHFPSAR